MDYKQLMASIESTVIENIQTYITNNKLTYTAESPDFIQGLTVGLEIGTKALFNIIKYPPGPKLLEYKE